MLSTALRRLEFDMPMGLHHRLEDVLCADAEQQAFDAMEEEYDRGEVELTSRVSAN